MWPDASSNGNSFFVHDFLTSNDDTAFRVIQLVNGDESKKSKLLADKLNFLSRRRANCLSNSIISY